MKSTIRKGKKSSSTSNHYVNNREFYEAIVDHLNKKDEAEAEGLDPPRIPEYIGDCILKIADRLKYHRWYINYSDHYKDEMVSDAVLICMNYFYNFDPEKTNNPFAYFTRICFNAFKKRVMVESRERYSIYKNAQKFMIDNDSPELTQATMYDNINDFIENYEERERNRKEEKKRKKEDSKDDDKN